MTAKMISKFGNRSRREIPRMELMEGHKVYYVFAKGIAGYLLGINCIAD
jgi:hypothetical protein